MENIAIIDSINDTSSWLVHNQALLFGYIINILAALIIAIFGMIIAKSVSNTVNRIMILHHIDATIINFFSTLMYYGIVSFTIIAALSRIGIQTASLIAIFSTIGLAISLAVQGTLANFAAGLLLVIFRPFYSGEYVDLGGIAGTVLQIQIFSTKLRTSDNRIVLVPNNKIISENIVNFSREPVRRNEFIVSVAYDSDVEKVKQLLTDIIYSDKRILKDHETIIRLNELGIFSINFIIRIWSKSSNLQYVYWDILERIKHDFDTNGIKFPLNYKCKQTLNI